MREPAGVLKEDSSLEYHAYPYIRIPSIFKLRIQMHVCVYGKCQNPKIIREGILIYGCMCVYAWYSNTLKSYAARRNTYTQTRIWIPSFIFVFWYFPYMHTQTCIWIPSLFRCREVHGCCLNKWLPSCHELCVKTINMLTFPVFMRPQRRNIYGKGCRLLATFDF